MQPGDEVHVINKYRSTHIICRVNSIEIFMLLRDADLQYLKLRLLGGCYVDGIMDGEISKEGLELGFFL